MIGCNTLLRSTSESCCTQAGTSYWKEGAELLRRSLLAIKHITRFDSSSRIDCDVALVDMANDAFFIDYKGGPISKALFFVEDAVVFHDSAFEIAE